MSEVTLVAVQDFSYSTRRLKAGDTFAVPEKMAKVLVGIKKAEFPREVGSVPRPPAALVEKVVAAAPAKEAPKPRRRARKSAAKK